MAQQGAITGDTLVWREGMTQWQRFSDIAGSLPPPEPRSEPDQPAITPTDENGADEHSGGRAAATPGVVPGPFGYGGFWIRLLARVIDAVILLAVIALAGQILDLVIANALGARPDADLLTAEGNDVMKMVLAGTYEVLFVRFFAATPGKMTLGLRILRADGTRLRSGRIFGREWARGLGVITLGFGYIMAGIDEEKRALHDRLCDTRVIRTR